MKRLIPLLFLAGCAGGNPPPSPQPFPVPVTTPRTVVFNAVWSAPSIGVGVGCTEDVPPVCTAGEAPWLTFDRPGTQGQACVDPAPNACYEADGRTLTLRTGPPGFPLFTRQTFDGAISVEVAMSAKCLAQDCYAGPVFYNGEHNYRALYYTKVADGLQVSVYTPVSYAGPISPEVYPAGSTHTLRIDYAIDTWLYYVDGVLKLTETPGSLGPDSTVLTSPPHVALFIGDAEASIGPLTVYTQN